MKWLNANKSRCPNNENNDDGKSAIVSNKAVVFRHEIVSK